MFGIKSLRFQKHCRYGLSLVTELQHLICIYLTQKYHTIISRYKLELHNHELIRSNISVADIHTNDLNL